jgi:hypothetical protein
MGSSVREKYPVLRRFSCTQRISGYHMAVVVAIVFFAIRASLALMPGANRYPIKKCVTPVEIFTVFRNLLPICNFIPSVSSPLSLLHQ